MSLKNFARLAAAAALGLATLTAAAAVARADAPPSARIDVKWAVKIPLRDGVRLNGTLYLPKGHATPTPCIFELTPYISDTYHARGVYFASHGLPFMIVDARGRGSSEGQFRPMIQEAKDGYDIVEWLAAQPFCNGKISMWGGSYAGYDQWATAKERPPHLATIVPVASPHAGADFPYRNNIASNYLFQWLTYTSGKTGQDRLFGDGDFWNALWRDRFEKGLAFNTLEHSLGGEQTSLREWLAHPEIDSYWESYVASDDQLRALTLPILTITGSYDGDQPGALTWYRRYMAVATPDQRARHYLIIGPWDHAGTRTPQAEFGGLKFGPNSLLDVQKLHVDWYNWTMSGGAKPDFLKKMVAYYVMAADEWRYADTLEAATAESRPFYLDSLANADRLFASGSLSDKAPGAGKPDRYVSDPRDVAGAALQAEPDATGYASQRAVIAAEGKALFYHTAPFDRDTELTGDFRLSAWIAIDQPDTDFQVAVFEVTRDGQSILLSTDVKRARYRDSLRQAKLVTTKDPIRYDFNSFTWMSRKIAKGSRLRLVISPMNTIDTQKNYNSDKPVNDQTMADARTVTVTLFHDKAHPTALYVPFGQPK